MPSMLVPPVLILLASLVARTPEPQTWQHTLYAGLASDAGVEQGSPRHVHSPHVLTGESTRCLGRHRLGQRLVLSWRRAETLLAPACSMSLVCGYHLPLADRVTVFASAGPGLAYDGIPGAQGSSAQGARDNEFRLQLGGGAGAEMHLLSRLALRLEYRYERVLDTPQADCLWDGWRDGQPASGFVDGRNADFDRHGLLLGLTLLVGPA